MILLMKLKLHWKKKIFSERKKVQFGLIFNIWSIDDFNNYKYKSILNR